MNNNFKGISAPLTIILMLLVLVALGVASYVAPRGDGFKVEEPAEQSDIEVILPGKNQAVQSPLAVSGRARGSWFFEAVFPIVIEDLSGKIIAQGQAQAAGDWMTSDFVMFDAAIDFTVAEKQNAVLVLRNDNPSGLPKKAKEFRVPVVLLPSAQDDFIKNGNLIQHNLGEGAWYLSYEEPGKPGLEAVLIISGESRCKDGEDIGVCDVAKFGAGQRVEISGRKAGDMVLVSVLTLLEQEAGQEKEVNLYYYNPVLDKDASGNVLCSRQGLVPVKRKIPATITPIQDTVKLLIAGGLTEAEKKQGITTEYPLAGFGLIGAAQKNGLLTLELSDPNNKTSGGSCRVGILWFQIEATAKQFEGVSIVKPKPETLFQP